MFQPENAFHIPDFFDDKQDVELLKLIPFLEYLAKVPPFPVKIVLIFFSSLTM